MGDKGLDKQEVRFESSLAEQRDEQRVALLGATPKKDRYAYKAFQLLREKGHRVFPVRPSMDELEGVPVYSSLGDIPEPVDTLTVYVGPRRIEPLIEDVVNLAPGRVILNPGTESDALKARLDQAGIPYLEACTLVMLNTGQFAL